MLTNIKLKRKVLKQFEYLIIRIILLIANLVHFFEYISISNDNSTSLLTDI